MIFLNWIASQIFQQDEHGEEELGEKCAVLMLLLSWFFITVVSTIIANQWHDADVDQLTWGDVKDGGKLRELSFHMDLLCKDALYQRHQGKVGGKEDQVPQLKALEDDSIME